MFSSINLGHITRVFNARRINGLGIPPHTLPCPELNNMFGGLMVEDLATNKKYKIKEFVKYWYDGWCIIARLEESCSCGLKKAVNVVWQKHMSEAIKEADEMRSELLPYEAVPVRLNGYYGSN